MPIGVYKRTAFPLVHGGSIRDENGLQKPIYSKWVGMRQRCSNKNKWDYKFYGERGIKVCRRWNKFENFLKDMGDSYEKHKKENTSTTLDRIDVNKGYSPSNCKWSNRFEQSNNRNYNKPVEYLGRKQPISLWIKELGLKVKWKLIYKRIFTRHWSVDRAFKTPCGAPKVSHANRLALGEKC
jgi:hypothetical protein